MPRLPLGFLIAIAAIAGAPARAAFLIQSPTAFGTVRAQGGTSTLDTSRLSAANDSRSGAFVDHAGTKFALATAVPAGATITSAALAFTVPSAYPAGSDTTTSILAISGSASATTTLALADFGAATANVAEAIVPTISAGTTPPSAYSFDVTSLVALLYARGAAAVFFQYDDLTSQTNILMAPYDGSGAAPTLTIQFTPAAATVPEPTSASLAALGLGLGLGLAGAVYAARRLPAGDGALGHQVG